MPYDQMSDDELRDELERLVEERMRAGQNLTKIERALSTIEGILNARGL